MIVPANAKDYDCQVPTCFKKATKEVHLNVKANRVVILFLCEEHFKNTDKYWDRICQPREIFELTPKEDDREKVQFT